MLVNIKIRQFIIWFIKKINLIQIINEIDSQNKIALCNNLVTNQGAVFHPESIVNNMQNNPLKIVIGKGTHIRGQLNLFRYGGKITIGEHCYIGDHSRIWSGSEITIGNFVQISHNVNVIDTSAHEFDAIERAERFVDLIENGPWEEQGNVLTSPIVIGDYAWISLNSTILRGVNIGEGAIIAANSVVTKNVPPYTLVAGMPARIIRNLK